MNIYLDTVGCRLNQAEIEHYARQFRVLGHTLVETPGQADLVVINTCAVTAAAASDSRQKARQAHRSGQASVVLTGCWATLHPEEAASLPGVANIFPNTVKDQLVSELLQVPAEIFEQEPIERRPIPGARLRTRAFIKVQDGCNNHCTFCVTRLARGAGHSRSIEQVLSDVRMAQEESQAGGNAAREIVLTGVHMGSWGADLAPARQLKHLVQAVLQEMSAARLRLSSLEPWDLDADFFALWQDPRLCRHLHLPLQSGCAATLRRMSRHTTPSEFADLVKAARQAIPGAAITTDIITGFPGESEMEFEESLEFVRRMRFADGHVFTFSSRPGTAAARLPGQVPHPVRKERNARMQAVLAESAASYRSTFVGETLPVLWENAHALGPQGWQLSGLTDNYLRVTVQAPKRLWNQITPVRLTGVVNDTLSGQV